MFFIHLSSAVATPSTDGGSGAASPASECSSDQPGTSSKEGEEEVYDKPPAPPLSADQQQALCQLVCGLFCCVLLWRPVPFAYSISRAISAVCVIMSGHILFTTSPAG